MPTLIVENVETPCLVRVIRGDVLLAERWCVDGERRMEIPDLPEGPVLLEYISKGCLKWLSDGCIVPHNNVVYVNSKPAPKRVMKTKVKSCPCVLVRLSSPSREQLNDLTEWMAANGIRSMSAHVEAKTHSLHVHSGFYSPEDAKKISARIGELQE